MSAYIVDDETINRILAGLYYSCHNSDYRWPRPSKSLEKLVRPGLASGALAFLGKWMFELNISAIEQRYGEGEAEKFRPLDYQYKLMAPPRRIHMYKSLQCFLYQCSEGDVPLTSELYKDLADFKDSLANSIVSSLPEYENAPWG